MLVRMQRKGNPFALLVGEQTGAAALENSMEVSQKIRDRTTLWPSNCTTRYLSKGYQNADLKGHVHPNVYSSTINSSQSMERAQMSTHWWRDKEDVVYIITMEYYSAIKKEFNLAICSEVEGARVYYAKRKQWKTDHMISLICGI